MSAVPAREVLGSREIARIFGVDVKTVVRWDHDGKLKAAFRTPGGHRRYYRDEVEPLLRGEAR